MSEALKARDLQAIISEAGSEKIAASWLDISVARLRSELKKQAPKKAPNQRGPRAIEWEQVRSAKERGLLGDVQCARRDCGKTLARNDRGKLICQFAHLVPRQYTHAVLLPICPEHKQTEDDFSGWERVRECGRLYGMALACARLMKRFNLLKPRRAS